MHYDTVVVGGGASGIVAAISAKRANPAQSVLVIERGERILKKVLITGNGRCNITNKTAEDGHYFSVQGQEEFSENTISGSISDVTSFFSSIGIDIVYEGNHGYPASLQASSVVDALRFECEHLGVEIITGQAVINIKLSKSGFAVLTQDDEYISHSVIIATGGMVSEQYGCDGTGYKLLCSFGHTKTKLLPSIVQLNADTSITKSLKGIKLKAAVSAVQSGKVQAECEDEVLFTDYGLSGPAVLAVSRAVALNGPLDIVIDWMSNVQETELIDILLKRQKTLHYRTCEEYLSGLMNKRLGQCIIKHSGVALSTAVSQLSSAEISNIAQSIKHFTIKATSTRSFKNATVTAGGIINNEFNRETLMSKKTAGLFSCGEVLDIDGECGGFNLQWAWASGMAAGKAAAEYNKKRGNNV